MVKCELPKLELWVRFPSPAPHRPALQLDGPWSVAAPALAHGLHGRFDVQRGRLMSEPGVLSLGELACTRKYLLAVVTFAVADGKGCGTRPCRVFRLETAFLLLQPRHEHCVKPCGDALPQDGAVDAYHGIFGRWFLPFPVESAQERGKVEPRSSNNNDRHSVRHSSRPFRGGPEPCAGGELLGRRGEVYAAHVEFRTFFRGRLGGADVHAAIDAH